MKPRLRLALLATAALTLAALGGARVLLRLDAADMSRTIALPRPIIFTIPEGASLGQVARMLAELGIVTDEWLLRLHVRLAGMSGSLQAGTYDVVTGDTPRAVIERIANGRTRTFTFTIVEGIRFDELRRQVRAQPYLEHTLARRSDAEIMPALGVPDTAPEGQFLPSTYHYKAGTTDLALLGRAHRHLRRVLDDAWQRRAPDLPYDSPYHALVMASIVEKETARAEERREIAGVFVRRLQKGMKLQTDPTVIYGLGETFDGNLRRADLQRDTAFNTYTRPGLPPTPIAMPGTAALEAALNPAPGSALYFVARGDGTHAFSATLDAHNDAVRTYQLRGGR